jgi:hypothetical protein
MRYQSTPNSIRLVNMSLQVVLLLFVLEGCEKKHSEEEVQQPEETAAVSALKQKVIAIHDEAMPLIGEIYQRKKSLTEKSTSDKSLSEEKKRELQNAVQQLDSADKGMRVWMRQFSEVKTTGLPEAEILENLKKELDKISALKAEMTKAIDNSKALE